MENLKKFAEKIKESELVNVDDYGFNDELKLELINIINEFWKNEAFEDRNIVLEDLKADEGYLYKKMTEWHYKVEKYDLGFDAFEYSIEDFFRDGFNKKDGFISKAFSIKDINKMMYN